jgi:hypothetical protein
VAGAAGSHTLKSASMRALGATLTDCAEEDGMASTLTGDELSITALFRLADLTETSVMISGFTPNPKILVLPVWGSGAGIGGRFGHSVLAPSPDSVACSPPIFPSSMSSKERSERRLGPGLDDTVTSMWRRLCCGSCCRGEVIARSCESSSTTYGSDVTRPLPLIRLVVDGCNSKGVVRLELDCGRLRFVDFDCDEEVGT